MKNQEIQGKLALFGKSIVVVGVNWNRDLIEDLILEYNLSSLECLSGIEIKNIASKVINKDIVVFSVKKAQHDIYDIVKQNSANFHHTEKINADSVFHELLESLTREVE